METLIRTSACTLPLLAVIAMVIWWRIHCGRLIAYTGVTRRLQTGHIGHVRWRVLLFTLVAFCVSMGDFYPVLMIFPSALSLIPNMQDPIMLKPSAINDAACSDPFNTYLMVYHPDQVDWPVVLIHLPPPHIPSQALAHPDLATGTVTIDLVLAPCGVADYKVTYGYIPYGLVDEVKAATQHIQFWPATHNGYIVPQAVRAKYEFYQCPWQALCSRVNEIDLRNVQR